jgi:hypothetical protein
LAPRLLGGSVGMSGGPVIMVERDPDTLEVTSLSAVRIADLP